MRTRITPNKDTFHAGRTEDGEEPLKTPSLSDVANTINSIEKLSPT